MCLALAAQKEHLDVLACLVELGADIDKADNFGNTPLSVAANSGHLAVVRYLLQSSADANQADKAGHSHCSGQPPGDTFLSSAAS
jgi:ankyrin repeat protein